MKGIVGPGDLSSKQLRVKWRGSMKKYLTVSQSLKDKSLLSCIGLLLPTSIRTETEDYSTALGIPVPQVFRHVAGSPAPSAPD